MNLNIFNINDIVWYLEDFIITCGKIIDFYEIQSIDKNNITSIEYSIENLETKKIIKNVKEAYIFTSKEEAIGDFKTFNDIPDDHMWYCTKYYFYDQCDEEVLWFLDGENILCGTVEEVQINAKEDETPLVKYNIRVFVDPDKERYYKWINENELFESEEELKEYLKLTNSQNPTNSTSD